jgi:hypothetical protein
MKPAPYDHARHQFATGALSILSARARDATAASKARFSLSVGLPATITPLITPFQMHVNASPDRPEESCKIGTRGNSWLARTSPSNFVVRVNIKTGGKEVGGKADPSGSVACRSVVAGESRRTI